MRSRFLLMGSIPKASESKNRLFLESIPSPSYRYYNSPCEARHVNAHITANKAARLYLKFISATVPFALRGIRQNSPQKRCAVTNKTEFTSRRRAQRNKLCITSEKKNAAAWRRIQQRSFTWVSLFSLPNCISCHMTCTHLVRLFPNYNSWLNV